MYVRRKTKRILVSILLIAFVSIVVVLGSLYLTGNFESEVTGLYVEEIESNDVVKTQKKKHFFVEENYVFEEGFLDLEDYRRMKIILSPGRIILKDNCTAIGVSITSEKSQNIAKAINGEFGIRPSEYDIIEEIIDNFDIKVDQITIDKIEEGIFYGHLVLHNDYKILKLDIKPSDALSIGLRFEAPIYVHEELIKKMSQEIC